MARSKLTLTCQTCGQEFERITFHRNRTTANQYDDWARENITECPDCYNRRLYAEQDAIYHFPPITGMSDKQIQYAETVRTRYVARNAKELAQAAKEIEKLKPDAIRQYAESHDCTEEHTRRLLFKKFYLLHAYIILTSGKATDILDSRNNEIPVDRSNKK